MYWPWLSRMAHSFQCMDAAMHVLTIRWLGRLHLMVHGGMYGAIGWTTMNAIRHLPRFFTSAVAIGGRAHGASWSRPAWGLGRWRRRGQCRPLSSCYERVDGQAWSSPCTSRNCAAANARFLASPSSQCQNQAEGAAVTHSQESHDPSSILQLWQPDWLPRLFDDVGTVTVVQDICERPATLAEETSAFRRKVDRSFGWHGKVLNDQQKSQRAAAQTTLQSLASTIVHSDLHVTVPTVLKLPCCQDQIHG